MKNFPFKHINPDTNKEEEFWYSRSVTTGLFVFVKDSNNNWFILANKRGEGCPDEVGKWNCPCGYLDFDETIEEAAARETFEETGIDIDTSNIKFFKFISSPFENKQNLAVIQYTILPGTIDNYIPSLTAKNSEKNEVSNIQFIRVSDVWQFKWAFNHQHYIDAIYNTYIFNLNKHKWNSIFY